MKQLLTIAHRLWNDCLMNHDLTLGFDQLDSGNTRTWDLGVATNRTRRDVCRRSLPNLALIVIRLRRISHIWRQQNPDTRETAPTAPAQ